MYIFLSCPPFKEEIKWRRESKKLKINNIAWRLNYSPGTGSIKFFLQKHQLWR
jgi:hypothetical protein